jgi:hypothetical protein
VCVLFNDSVSYQDCIMPGQNIKNESVIIQQVVFIHHVNGVLVKHNRIEMVSCSNSFCVCGRKNVTLIQVLKSFMPFLNY